MIRKIWSKLFKDEFVFKPFELAQNPPTVSTVCHCKNDGLLFIDGHLSESELKEHYKGWGEIPCSVCGKAPDQIDAEKKH